MKKLKGTYGECRFCDNMDPDEGLPSLAEKSWDLCLTDPPYNIKYKKPSGLGAKPNAKNKYINPYEDNKSQEAYLMWCEKWFHSLMECTQGILFSPGRMNLSIWYHIQPPEDYIIWYKKNAQGGAKWSHFAKEEPFLIYGQLPKKFTGSVLEVYVINGFLCEEIYIHPVPKSINLWETILTYLQPTSVIDPFLGSGTTAEVCESLGIPWLGYEIMEEYAVDIDKRITQGQTKYAEIHFKPPTTQKTMDCFGRGA